MDEIKFFREEKILLKHDILTDLYDFSICFGWLMKQTILLSKDSDNIGLFNNLSFI